jgi:tripartite-type tricarboxylate transporter receptor subunit TctC
VRNPDSWEGYYWGAKHVWGFDNTRGEPFQDAVWDDVLEHAEMVIFSGSDPEATGLGMSGSVALEMPRWLKRAGIKIIALSPDHNNAPNPSVVVSKTAVPAKNLEEFDCLGQGEPGPRVGRHGRGRSGHTPGLPAVPEHDENKLPAVVESLADPHVRQRFAEIGQEIWPREQQTPEALRTFHKEEIAKWWPIAKAANSK